ncbi:glycine zipper 2TM domain-containing protein [Noviherbaspirillum galbum]|uniref:Glycine zipper 2TM domain-containing protein n=1 Tax=Noviherbaspirillum galbum TaxID=2709383 RepID=A0A6B3STH2_9BURK|nr:glycine zipper 2TM domain-containing protein [Noviherbaspirillum galbum]NEX63931.1 glycine zipper 2TM domain-containing protein [Noviherbaspirillum galbum]
MLNKFIAIASIIAVPALASATSYQIVEQPRQECWNEQVPVQTSSQGIGGAIVGGVAGGILGNQVGGGSGKTVATAVGAATGAVVGDRMAAQGSARGTSYQTVQRCRTVVEQVKVPVQEQRGHFCPPGQAKKGNC